MTQVYALTEAYLKAVSNGSVRADSALQSNTYPVVTIMATRGTLELTDGEGSVYTVYVPPQLLAPEAAWKARVPGFVDALLGYHSLAASRAQLIDWLRAEGFVATLGAVKGAQGLTAGFGEQDHF